MCPRTVRLLQDVRTRTENRPDPTQTASPSCAEPMALTRNVQGNKLDNLQATREGGNMDRSSWPYPHLIRTEFPPHPCSRGTHIHICKEIMAQNCGASRDIGSPSDDAVSQGAMCPTTHRI